MVWIPPAIRPRGLWATAAALLLVSALAPDVPLAQPAPSFGAAAPTVPPSASASRVVVLLFEGFAPTLLSAAQTPAFDRLREEGAWTHRLTSVFPTQGWVNGASLATGCWPAQHGIVSETFVDPERGDFDREPLHGWLTGCEPLGDAARRQGVAVHRFGWYGLDPDTEADRCDSGARRRDAGRRRALLDHLRAPADPAGATTRELVQARFCAPGDSIRRNGVDTPASAAVVAELDSFVGEVVAAIETRGDETLLFVVTDHGMRDVSHLIQLPRILAREGVDATVKAAGSTALLYLPEGADAAAIQQRLSAYDFFEVLSRDALPAYAHLGEGPRVPELILSAYPPYFIEAKSRWPYWLSALGLVAPDHLWAEWWRSATSGFVPRTPAMYGLVYVWGHGVEGGREAQALRVIDLHPTIAEVLGIAPGEPLDGRVATTLLRAAPSPGAEGGGSLP